MVIMVVERILGIKKNSNVGFKSINIYFFINIKYQTNPGATPKGNEKIFSEENLTCSTRLQLYKGSSLFYFGVAFYEQPCSKAGEIRFVVYDMCLCLCLCERDWGREEDVNSESPICGGDYSFVFSLQTQIRHLGFSTKIPSQVTQRLLGFPIWAKLKNNSFPLPLRPSLQGRTTSQWLCNF